MAILVSACLALAGCSLFGKKKPEAEQPPQFPPQAAANTTAPGTAKGSAFSTTSNPKVAAPGAAGMLAGRVICNYDRQPPPTIIQVVTTGEKTSDSNGQDTTTDPQGYFTIQGLIPGQGYQLTARTRPGDVKMSGVTIATAPNPRVLIVISEEFGTPPPAPKKNNDKTSSANETSRDDAPTRPGAPSATGSTAELSPPTGETGGRGNAKEVTSLDQSDRERIPLSMAGAGRGPPPSEGYGGARQVSARVPSCTFSTEWQLDNFALYDLTGMPWEYRNHKGRLVLIDFWGTWCTYCVKGIPHLKSLHESYSKYGLEIVGIAYEQPAPAGDQARLVQEKRDQLRIPYRLLLGSNLYTCPVKTQFKVSAFPTMFLLDESGKIIWKKDHALNDVEKRELDQIIRKELK